MTYNLYIKTHSNTYNILNIDKGDLDIIINAFNVGKEDFFIGGKKYWITNLFEIRIFTFMHPDRFQDFISLAKSKRLFVQGFFGDQYLEPVVLREGGF